MNFTENLITKVFCRLGVSKIHGVGVFAIRDIPKGINPMEEMKSCDFEEVNIEDLKCLTQLPLAVHQFVIDMCPQNGATFSCPKQGLNSIGIAWYLNHSTTPNMEEQDGNFYALADIPAGTELTVNYGTYGALNL
jgi:SET domain-containing protein